MAALYERCAACNRLFTEDDHVEVIVNAARAAVCHNGDCLARFAIPFPQVQMVVETRRNKETWLDRLQRNLSRYGIRL